MRATLIAVTLLLAMTSRATAQVPESERAYIDQIESFQVRNAEADAVVTILNEQFPGTSKFSANTATNMVYARIPKSLRPEISLFIEQLEDDAARSKADKQEQQQAEQRKIQKQERRTTVIRLQHVSPIEMMLILDSLGYHNDALPIAQGPQSDSIIARGTASSLQELEAFIETVDRPTKNAATQNQPAAAALATDAVRAKMFDLEVEHNKLLHSFGPNHPRVRQLEQQIALMRKHLAETTQSPQQNPADPAIDSGAGTTSPALGAEYEAAEREAARLADRWRREEIRGELSDTEMEKLRVGVAKQVKAAFQIRQNQKRAELNSMQRQLDTIRKRLDLRDKIADRVIDRRVEDLISGADLSWLSREDRAENRSIVTQRPSNSAAQGDPARQIKSIGGIAEELEGDVKIELLNEIGAIVVRGHKKDVQRVVGAIETIEESDEVGAQDESKPDSGNSDR